ncbi:hypothetical protein OAG68_02825 [bacterium]|nr:hypothetical protein [bacterium]
MARISALILIANIVFACVAITSAQEEISPGQAIGTRVELVVSSKIEGGEFICDGIVVQVDQEKLTLEEVNKTETSIRGVPFLSNLSPGSKLFTNVVAFKKVELEFGIVLPLDRIKSCRIAEGNLGKLEPQEWPSWVPAGLNRTGRFQLQGARKGCIR